MADWNKRFMDVSRLVASWSKDKKKKVGAIIVKNNRIIGTGFNGFVKGALDNDESKHQKPKKNFHVIHAETNSIYNCAEAGVSTKGATIFVTWHPCSSCVNAIIQSGIIKLICPEPDFTNKSYADSFKEAQEILKDAKVEVIYYKEEE